MKITVEQEKPVFKPITITLETAQEYFELVGALSVASKREVNNTLQMISPNLVVPEYNQASFVCLYNSLYKMFDKVKETL